MGITTKEELEPRIGLILGDRTVGFLDELPAWAQAYIRVLWRELKTPELPLITPEMMDQVLKEMKEQEYDARYNRSDLP